MAGLTLGTKLHMKTVLVHSKTTQRLGRLTRIPERSAIAAPLPRSISYYCRQSAATACRYNAFLRIVLPTHSNNNVIS